MDQDKNSLQTLYRWRTATFLVMVFGYIGYYMIRQNLSAAFPLMHTALGYTNAQLGVIAASSEIAYAVGKFLNGPLIDRYGGKRIFLLGMAGGIACNFVFAAGSTLLWFVMAWCLCRYFLSMGWGSVTKTMGNWYEPEKNGRVMGFASLSLQFGGVVAALFAGWLVSMGQSWERLFIIPALVLCVFWVVAYSVARAKPSDVVAGASFRRPGTRAALAIFSAEGEASTGDMIKTLLKLPVFRHLLVFSFLTTALRSIFIFWTPKFLVDIGMGAANAIFSSAIFPLLGGIGVVALGWYTDTRSRGNRAPAMCAMLVGLFVSLLGIVWVADAGAAFHPLLIVLLGLSGFFLLGPYSMSAGSLSLDIAGPRAAGTCVGLVDGVGYLGGALAAWGVGALSDNRSWSQIFLLLACSVPFVIASAFAMSRHFQRVNLLADPATQAPKTSVASLA